MPWEPGQSCRFLSVDLIELRFCACEAKGQFAAVGQEGELVEGPGECLAQAFDLCCFGIDAVEAPLHIAICAFERAGCGSDEEVKPSTIGRPLNPGLEGLIVRELAGFAAISADEIDFVVGRILGAAVDGAGQERQGFAVG